MATTSYIKTNQHNTNYYRRNKIERFCVHTCPHCNYETTGPKQCIQAHIWAKHTPENEKPFQCPCGDCHRGFAARANLLKHLRKVHGALLPSKFDKNILIYKIKCLNKPKTNQELERFLKYKKNNLIKKNELKKLNISLDDLHYDKTQKFIDFTSYTRQQLLTLYYKPQDENSLNV